MKIKQHKNIIIIRDLVTFFFFFSNTLIGYHYIGMYIFELNNIRKYT